MQENENQKQEHFNNNIDNNNNICLFNTLLPNEIIHYILIDFCGKEKGCQAICLFVCHQWKNLLSHKYNNNNNSSLKLYLKYVVQNISLLKWSFTCGGLSLRNNKYKICYAAAHEGSLQTLQYARLEKQCQWDWITCSFAAREGHLHVLQWLRENGCPWNEETCSSAAKGGHLHVLQWARENGCPWDWETCPSAAKGGHLHVLKWLREHDCPWGEYTCSLAAQEGHLHVLQWLRENGCPWNKEHALAITRDKETSSWIEKQQV